jgi:hypothetical protein
MWQPRLLFLATLNLSDLSKLMNDHVSHDPTWPPVPTKLLSDIPKFEGKNGEDPGDHVTTFQLWCSSNSLNDNSIRFMIVSTHSHYTEGSCWDSPILHPLHVWFVS